MAKHGLGLVDWNLRARLALFGLSDETERDIATLLRSGQPIESGTLELIADALEGKDGIINLKATGVKRGSFYRSLRGRLIDIRIGELVEAREEELGYQGAIEEVAREAGISDKSVQRALTFSRQARKWIGGRTPNPSDPDGLDEFCLRVAYAYADKKSGEPDDFVRASLPDLAELLNKMDQVFRDSQSPQLARQPKFQISVR